jgi:hypothetical protein
MVGVALVVILALNAGLPNDPIAHRQLNNSSKKVWAEALAQRQAIREGETASQNERGYEASGGVEPITPAPQEPEATPEPVSTLAPTPEPYQPPPEPPETPAPIVAVSDPELIICGVFGAYCSDALAVARCESTDYSAPGDGYHIGPFQLAFKYHADKFAAHGWNMWLEGNDVYKNSVIAWEIFVGRGYSWIGTSGWPVCGWEAGY